jgi:hypothetical protein
MDKLKIEKGNIFFFFDGNLIMLTPEEAVRVRNLVCDNGHLQESKYVYKGQQRCIQCRDNAKINYLKPLETLTAAQQQEKDAMIKSYSRTDNWAATSRELNISYDDCKARRKRYNI